jgi:hypothetical protein
VSTSDRPAVFDADKQHHKREAEEAEEALEAQGGYSEEVEEEMIAGYPSYQLPEE